MKHKLIIFLTLASFFCYGQNIIPNHSFETPTYNKSYSLTNPNRYELGAGCSLTLTSDNIDNWTVNFASPDWIYEQTASACRDNDLAQDGDKYLIVGNSESMEVEFTDTLQSGCLYQFTAYLNPETINGTLTNASSVSFIFTMPYSNTITTPLISFNLWQQFSVPFTASMPSTIFRITSLINNAGMEVDNVSVVKMGCPLPVVMMYFRGQYGNTIEWATATETNCSHYDLYKSNDYKNWSLLARVNGAGNTSQPSYYSIQDNPGEFYYVIKQVDIDGTKTYSDILHIGSHDEEVDILPVYNILGQLLRQ